jgi:hypothetical protein
MIFLAIILAIILGLVQFFSKDIVRKCGKYYIHFLSFSAGISITYVFVHLFPHFSREVVKTNQYIFFSLLIGFIFVHLIEKYIYQHSSIDKIDNRLGVINQFTSVIYHIILGFVIFDFAEESLENVFLLFIPIIIFTAVRTFPVRTPSSIIIRLVGSLSTLIGIGLAWILFDTIQGGIQIGLIGFVIGGLLFSVIRHSIP